MKEILPPTTPSPAKMAYPETLQKAIDQMNVVHAEWAKQDSALAELEDDLLTAKQTDLLALREAAIANEPDPGKNNTETAERAIEYQYEKTKYARGEAQKAGQLVIKLIKENRIEVIDLSIAAASAGVEKFKQDVSLIQTNYEASVKARHEALAGLTMVGRMGITQDLIQFEPHFPIGGHLVVPNPREDRVLGLLEVLEKLFHPADPEKPASLHAKLKTPEAPSKPVSE